MSVTGGKGEEGGGGEGDCIMGGALEREDKGEGGEGGEVVMIFIKEGEFDLCILTPGGHSKSHFSGTVKRYIGRRT